MINKSKKKEYYVQIETLKFNGKENIAYVFKFTEIMFKKKKKKLNNKSFIPKCDKHLVMFDLLKLCYIRTFVVEVKSGFNNLKSEDENEYLGNNKKENYRLDIKRTKRKKKFFSIDEDYSSEESEKNINTNILTNEKLIELQEHNYSDILIHCQYMERMYI